MKNISLLKADSIKKKFKEIGIIVSAKDVQILSYLLDIYERGLNGELLGVENINGEYIFIKSTQQLIDRYYPQIKKIRASNYFRIKIYTDLGLLERELSLDKRHSYFKPTYLLKEYLK